VYLEGLYTVPGGQRLYSVPGGAEDTVYLEGWSLQCTWRTGATVYLEGGGYGVPGGAEVTVYLEGGGTVYLEGRSVS
jgi:lysozyme family protein